MKDKLSVLLPAYNEEKMINKACNRIAELLDKAEIVYEIIVVDDGSRDGTWTEIKKEGFCKLIDILNASETDLQRAYLIGPVRARNIYNLAMNAVLEYIIG